MSHKKCLGCYQSMELELPGNYHTSCSKKLFGTDVPPIISFGMNELEDLALKSLSDHLGLTGVQPKISIHLEKDQKDPTHRLMIVDMWGNFILKPPTKKFPQMSVVEDLTMHMGEICGLNVARHGLVQLHDGEFAYVTKRFDRPKKGKKLAVEDFCQLSELLTESKYNTSTEKAGKIILKYSSHPGLDAIAFFDLILFSFLVGNADMHLKNFSLMRRDEEIILSPFYDLLSTKILMPEDKEEMALTINAKKSKIKKDDLLVLGKSLQIMDKVLEKRFEKILKCVPEMKELIGSSFLTDEFKANYLKVISDRVKVLEGKN